MSAFGGKADTPLCAANVRFRPEADMRLAFGAAPVDLSCPLPGRFWLRNIDAACFICERAGNGPNHGGTI